MFYKKLYIAIIASLVICNAVDGKKSKKNKLTKEEDEYTTIQPNVVAYSTFGFNDVGAYDGFVPTSPDYASFLSGGHQESTTRLYAPAFPSAADSTGFSSGFVSPTGDGQSYNGPHEEGVVQSGMLQYAPVSMNFYNTPSLGTVTDHLNQNTGPEESSNQRAKDSDAPVYGTKISSRHKIRGNILNNQFNHSDYGQFTNGYEVVEPSQEDKPLFEPNNNYQTSNTFGSNIEPHEIEEFSKSTLSNAQSVSLNFPRVIDFTKLNTYPSDLDNDKFMSNNVKQANYHNSVVHNQAENSFDNVFNNHNHNKFSDSMSTLRDHYTSKTNADSSDKTIKKPNSVFEHDESYNHVTSQHKHHSSPGIKSNDHKKKIKHKPWSSGNYSSDFRNWKDATLKGYGYSTNYSNMNFKYDVDEPKKPFNLDEIVPASSNVVDLTNYHHYPEKNYHKPKRQHEYTEDDADFPNSVSTFNDKLKSNVFLNQFKDSFSTVPTTTSYWGNVYKPSDYSSFRDYPKKTHYSEINHDEVVTIPKRPSKLHTKINENIQDWPSSHHRPYKSKPSNDWNKDTFDTRYKSEEDLLGLRTHDTSHPAYLPAYKPSSSVHDNDSEFKQLVEKWRQSYIKSKYKDVPVRDYESYGSEVKSMHVPVPKPYPIEVPHPVIVPVPQPFAVRVPVSRPVAVPVVREITVAIEKPVPYPVYKNVPYPVEKLVPVPVEREVTVPVDKPYPVHIPYVRPVFHHTRPHDDRDIDQIDDDDFRRPDPKKTSQFKKRPYGARYSSRRPSKSSYQERNRRRWPERRRPAPHNPEHRHHPRPSEYHSPTYKHRDFEPDAEEDENNDYAHYCRRTGKC